MTKLDEVAIKHGKIVSYLILSGGLGYLLATYIAKDPMLTMIFSPAVNYILWVLEKELKNEGVISALKK